MKKYIPRRFFSLKSFGNFTGCGLRKQFLQQEWFFKTHIVIEASAGEVEPLHPRSFTAKAENNSPFGMVIFYGRTVKLRWGNSWMFFSKLIEVSLPIFYWKKLHQQLWHHKFVFWCKKQNPGVKFFFEQQWVKGCQLSSEVVMNYPCGFRNGNPSLWFGLNDFQFDQFSQHQHPQHDCC